MKTTLKYMFLFLVGATMLATESCTENIDMSDRYTFTEETITSYLEKHEEYSEYVRLLGEVRISQRSNSTVLQMLSARGHYTVFAPTNTAIQRYLESVRQKGLIEDTSWDAMTNTRVKDSLMQVIVYNSVLDCGDQEAIQTGSFPEDLEEFAMPNLNDRKITICYNDTRDSMFINGVKENDGTISKGSLIDLRNQDILATNGYIHQVHDVVAPSSETLADILRGYIETNTTGLIIWAKLLDACGLYDTLSVTRDEVYEHKMLTEELENLPGHSTFNNKSPGYLPEHRKYGFTIFAETDDFWEQAIGKPAQDISPADIQAWVVRKRYYPTGQDNTNYKESTNVLNLFVTYHILPMRIPVDKLVIHYNEKGYYYVNNPNGSYNVPTWELYTTMGQRRLLKIYEGGKNAPTGIFLNRFPELDDERDGTYLETSCAEENRGFEVLTAQHVNVVNGYIYPIQSNNGETLAYTDATTRNLMGQRLRFDAASLFPEFMNNDIRGDRVGSKESLCVGIPCNNNYKYLDDLDIMEGTNFYYLSGFKQGWLNYQGDEMNVTGQYEMTLRLPPVPRKTTYEIRYAVQNNSDNRGMCQVYFGTNKDALPAAGIPLDLRIGGNTGTEDTNPLGYRVDVAGDDDYNAEIDKKMRNKGFMKGPQHYAPQGGSLARQEKTLTRRIIVQQEMDPDKVYYLKFKSVLRSTEKEFYMDYIEFCAKEVYNNPAKPEDLW